jgi:Ca2+-binding RTX toxin-like protein
MRKSLLASILVLLFAPSAAQAASTVFASAGEVDIFAAAGVENTLTITANVNPNGPETVVFSDPADVINADASAATECSGEGTNTVTCVEEYEIWFANVDDLADDVTANGTLGGEISGGSGGDTIIGSDNNLTDEEHFGDDGEDDMNGRGGSDELTGDEGNDTVRGGPGEDFLYEDYEDGNDLYDGGEGTDEYEIESDFANDVSVINLAAGTARHTGPGVDETDSIPNMEDADVIAPFGPATVTGTEGANVIRTGQGNDNIAPLGGADVVRAEGGNDTIDARDGFADNVRCGNGTDTVQADQHDQLSDCENVTIEQRRAAGADLVAPACTLARVKRSYSRKAFLKGFTPDVDCNEPATLEIALLATVKAKNLTARAGDLVLAERNTPAGANVRVRPSKKLAKRLRKTFRARLVVEARDEFGNRSVLRRTFKVKKAKRKKR